MSFFPFIKKKITAASFSPFPSHISNLCLSVPNPLIPSPVNRSSHTGGAPITLQYTTVQIHNKYTNIQIHKYTSTQYIYLNFHPNQWVIIQRHQSQSQRQCKKCNRLHWVHCKTEQGTSVLYSFLLLVTLQFVAGAAIHFLKLHHCTAYSIVYKISRI